MFKAVFHIRISTVITAVFMWLGLSLPSALGAEEYLGWKYSEDEFSCMIDKITEGNALRVILLHDKETGDITFFLYNDLFDFSRFVPVNSIDPIRLIYDPLTQDITKSVLVSKHDIMFKLDEAIFDNLRKKDAVLFVWHDVELDTLDLAGSTRMISRLAGCE